MPPDVIEYIKTGGMTLLLGYMWFRAEARADREREKNEVLAKDMISAMVSTNVTLTNLGNIFTSIGRTPGG
jgi:hypothetical protein